MKALRHVLHLVLAVGILVMSAGTAEAAFIRNAFGLVAPDATITFDELGLSTDTIITTQYGGLELDPSFKQQNVVGSPFAGISGGYAQNFLFDALNPIHDPFSIIFDGPVSAAAFALATNLSTGVNDSTSITPYLNGVAVGGPATAYVHNALLAFAYIGIVDVIFDEIRINVQGNGAAVLDNIQYKKVPEPTTLALFGTLAVGLAARARRRAARRRAARR